MNKQEDRELKMIAILASMKFIFPALIILIGIFVSIFKEKPGPLDTCLAETRDIVRHVSITDSTRNGFRVVYATRDAVCPKRLEEIQFRKNVWDGYRLIEKEIPLRFNNNLLDADIYDFLDVLLEYEIDPDIVVFNIFVEGKEKMNMYAKFNPDIYNCATWIDRDTEQGVQYISEIDVKYRHERRCYRYWRCGRTSNTDERFSHFSEIDRIGRKS